MADATSGHTSVMEFYTRALAEGTQAFEQVGWESRVIQRARFEALLQALTPNDLDGARVLDVGCGLGDLVGYLQETHREVEYLGLDLHPEMVRRARERYPEAQFECADVLDWDAGTTFDLVLCSGGLSLRYDDEETSWRVIERLFELTRRAAAFNVQSVRGLQVPGATALRTDFWHVDSAEMLPRLRRISANLALREDVVPSDSIIYFYRDYSPAFPSVTADPVARAELHVQRQEFATALDTLNTEGIAEEVKGRAAYLRGICYAFLDDGDAAGMWLWRAYEHDPHDLDVTESLVHFSLALGETAKAEALVAGLYAAAPEASPELRDTIRMPLHEILLAEEPAAAIALELEVETSFARMLMEGGRFVATGQLVEAEAVLKRAMAERPWDARPRPLLAAVFLRTRRFEDALGEAATVLSSSPTSEAARQVALEAMRSLARTASRGGRAGKRARTVLKRVTAHPVLGTVAKRLVH